MRERLKTAIEKMERYRFAADMPLRADECLGIVLAAARAYACEECGGRGWLPNFPSIVCQACKADRELADGGEVK